jgi:hypothetical protein
MTLGNQKQGDFNLVGLLSNDVEVKEQGYYAEDSFSVSGAGVTNRWDGAGTCRFIAAGARQTYDD